MLWIPFVVAKVNFISIVSPEVLLQKLVCGSIAGMTTRDR